MIAMKKEKNENDEWKVKANKTYGKQIVKVMHKEKILE